MAVTSFHSFLDFYGLPVVRIIFFPSLWLLYYKTIAETKIGYQRLMNPVAITTCIINPWKELAEQGARTSDPPPPNQPLC